MFEPGCTALVTGGSRGIGRAVVLALAAAGVDVAFCYRTEEARSEEVEAAGRDIGARVEGFRADVTDEAAVKDLYSKVGEAFGPVDVLVNNAGIRRDKALVMMSATAWDEVLATNLTAVYRVSRIAFRSMCRRRKGVIVNVGSLVGSRVVPGQANYAAAKAGLVGFTKVMAQEGAKYGVRANVVLPGLVDTEMTRDIVAAAVPLVPLGRAATADEIALGVVYLASAWASYVTGVELTIDGGLSSGMVAGVGL